MKNVFIIALLLLNCLNNHAAILYVAQTPTGSGDGSAATNRIAVSTLNSSGYKAGNIYSIGGTLTDGMCIGCNGGGTAGNPVTILFETNAMISLVSGEPFYLGGASYVTIDGGYNGLIENTGNGSSLARTNVSLIQSTGGNGLIVKNLTIRKQYVHSSLTDSSIDIGASGAVYVNGGLNDFVVSNCVFSDCGWCLNLQTGGKNILISSCTFSNFDHAIAVGGSVPVDGLMIANCHFGATSNWDTTANTYHHDGIHVFAAATLENLTIANNEFYGNWGNNNTAHIYLETGADPATANICNNDFHEDPNNILGNGFFCGAGNVSSNTFTGSGMGEMTAVRIGSGSFVGNTISSVGTFIAYATGSLTLSNNVYSHPVASGNLMFSIGGTGVGTFAEWKARMGDANSKSSR